jgi:CBS domain-containing protein
VNLKIADLMAKRVVSAQPHHSVEHVRNLLANNRIHAVPVVGPDKELLGVISSADLMEDLKSGTPISSIMTTDVRTIPAYNDVSAAARMMRRHKVHHAVVTHEKKVVGMLSSFDLLKLVEGHRFTMHAAPTATKKKRKGGR